FIVSNALKFFPGAGTVVAGLISGTTASAIMASLAFAYIEVLTVLLKKAKTGDDIDDKELEEMLKKLYKDNLKNHKKLK
ncbi:MAG: GTP-binding protein, partial [Fenollaria timonensis]